MQLVEEVYPALSNSFVEKHKKKGNHEGELKTWKWPNFFASKNHFKIFVTL